MIDLEVAKKIVEKLNSGKFGLLTLAKEYKISPKRIVELPRFVEEKEKREKIKSEFLLEQKKSLLIGKVDHYLALLEQTIRNEKEINEGYSGSGFVEYCQQYIKALEELEKQIKKSKSKEEFEILEELANSYFDGIEIKDNEITVFKHPNSRLVEWLESDQV